MEVKSGKKILKKFEKYINYLNPLKKNGNSEEELDKKSKIRTIIHNGIEWLDIESPTRKDLSELSEKHDFHPLHVEACFASGELDRVETEDKYVFILLHSPNYKKSEDKILSNKVCIFIGKNYLISVHGNEPKVLESTFSECESNEEFREAFFRKSSSRLLYSVIDVLENEISVLLQTIIQELDDIEDLVFDVKRSGIYKISQLRQRIVRLRRIALSFREISQNIVILQHPLTVKTNRYYKRVSNNVNKLWEIIEETRETVEIYKDADFTVSTEKTNKILTVLTIVFTLSIPGTLIGSLYGMNVVVPGGIDSGPWTFFGEFTTFFVVIGYSVVSATVMLLYFKYRDWF